MTRHTPEGAFSAAALPHRSSQELRELSRRADERETELNALHAVADSALIELDAARARAAEDDEHVRAFAQKNGQLWAENERLRALLSQRATDVHEAAGVLNAFVAEHGGRAEAEALALLLNTQRTSEIRSAARNAASVWTRDQYDGNDEQITDRLRSCLNRLADVIRRYDEKKSADR